MKKFQITDKSLTKIIQNSIQKKLFEDKTKFSVEPNVNKTPREDALGNVFGPHSNDIPNDILRYMRKNPRRIIARLLDIYGMNTFNYIVKGILTNKEDITEQIVDDEFNVEPDSNNEIDVNAGKKDLIDIEYDLTDDDVEEIMSHQGKMKRFRGSIYYDGVVPETEDKEYDRNLAIKIIDWDRKHMRNGETYVGGAGFKQRSLTDPYDNMEF